MPRIFKLLPPFPECGEFETMIRNSLKIKNHEPKEPQMTIQLEGLTACDDALLTFPKCKEFETIFKNALVNVPKPNGETEQP